MHHWDFPNLATPVGSTLYYGIRFSAPERHNDLAILAALQRQLEAIPIECTDPSVARAKLQWWREELERIRHNQGQHPLSDPLTAIIKQHQLPNTLFDQTLEAIAVAINGEPIADLDQLESLCERQFGTLTELFARCHGETDAVALQVARQLGAFVQMVDTIRNLGLDLRRGRLLLPNDLLQRFQLNRTNLHWEQFETQRRAMLRELSQHASNQLTHTLGLRKSPYKNTLTAGHIMAAISQTVLDELRSSQFPVMQERLSITPLRKVWIAWRIRRRTKKA